MTMFSCTVWIMRLSTLDDASLDSFSQHHAISRRDAEQLGPHQVRLEFVYDAVGHHHFPQHLNDAFAAGLVELAAKHAGER